MSSALAIATVTAVLKDLLNDGVANSNLGGAVGTVTVSALPPDRIGTGDEEPSRLNLFLFQVTGNQGWRNKELPFLNSDGTKVSSPPLALDLHYLLTAYGSDDLDAEILLGYAMQVLHEVPVLTRPIIRKTFGGTSPVTDKLLPAAVPDRNAADLADQVELCKISPKYPTTEELSRLWAAMQARYRPSVAYEVSVVLIEATTPARANLPVRTPVLTAVPISLPAISSIDPAVALAGGSLTVLGQSLKGATTRVRINGTLVEPAADDVSDRELTVPLPTGLLAGVMPVQVVHEVALGDPPSPHDGVGFESNVAAVVLAPRVVTGQPVTATAGGTLTLGVEPAVGRDQRASVLIGDSVLPVPARQPTDPATAGTVTVTLPPGLAVGSYLLRVQVDGALSSLESDDDPGSPTFGRYVGPLIEVT